MKGLTYTLLGDGSSDRVLDHPVRWALASMGVGIELGQWADLRHKTPKPSTMAERARAALELYPAPLLLVHRDAERDAHAQRLAEITTALEGATGRYVAIVPVRMTEAWLLHDEAAIRRASGNPSGTVSLRLPAVSDLENVVDPKTMLETALLDASELGGRRRQKRRKEFPQMRARTAELIADYSPLRELPAFSAFLSSLRAALVDLGALA